MAASRLVCSGCQGRQDLDFGLPHDLVQIQFRYSMKHASSAILSPARGYG